MKGQKEAVVDYVCGCLPTFKKGEDIALVMLTNDQLESIKFSVAEDIMLGRVEYSKPLIQHEVTAYARAMVMNHMKKSRELNGGQAYGKSPAATKASAQEKKLSKVDMDSLPQDLKEFVKNLV